MTYHRTYVHTTAAVCMLFNEIMEASHTIMPYHRTYVRTTAAIHAMYSTVEDNNNNTEYHSRQKQRISILLFIGILIFCSDKG